MSNHPFSRYFYYKELTSENSTELQKLAIAHHSEGKKLPAILGGSIHENQQLAKAYSENKGLYPYSYLIFDKSAEKHDTPIGCLIAQKSGKDFDVEIVITGEHSHLQTIVVLGEFRKFLFSIDECNLSFTSDDERVMEILDSYGLLNSIEDEEDSTEEATNVAE